MHDDDRVRSTRRRWAIDALSACLSLCALGCGDDKPAPDTISTDSVPAVPSGNAGASAASDAGSRTSTADAGPPATPACDSSDAEAPQELRCTGLYADVASKRISESARAFSPALELWSDGAEKTRWIALPEGTQIDNSDPDDWRFPIGTKLFKEFSVRGSRAETRMFWKAGEGRWVKATYRWSADESGAERFSGGEVRVAGQSYYIPSSKECDQCHKGRDDRALGFEAILLGLPGASGLTLARLAEADLLSTQPAQTELAVGDDGTGRGADALGYLHVNCGVSCHNDTPASEAFATDLRLRLAVNEARGGSTGAVDAITTSVGVNAETPRWSRYQRIVPGSPRDSLIYELASTRDARNPDDQMPPIASSMVDRDGVALLQAWIAAMR